MTKLVSDHIIDKDRIALGIRQPWIELILRGEKTVEVRSQNANVRGTIYLYSAKKFAEQPFAKTASEKFQLDHEQLPLGVIVGSVEIVDSMPCKASDSDASCVPANHLKNKYAWRLANPQRFAQPLSVKFLPYGVWFYPFKRRPKA